jgi:hypothetical protein
MRACAITATVVKPLAPRLAPKSALRQGANRSSTFRRSGIAPGQSAARNSGA